MLTIKNRPEKIDCESKPKINFKCKKKLNHNQKAIDKAIVVLLACADESAAKANLIKTSSIDDALWYVKESMTYREAAILLKFKLNNK